MNTHLHGGFPLRSNFFRSLPVDDENASLLHLAKNNAKICLKQTFNDQWRYVPPEKDGVQIRKDTSNMGESHRLIRVATVVRCQEHEMHHIVANPCTDSWRNLMKECFGKYYIDAMVLHAVKTPHDIEDKMTYFTENDKSVDQEKTHSTSGDDDSHSHSGARESMWMVDIEDNSSTSGKKEHYKISDTTTIGDREDHSRQNTMSASDDSVGFEHGDDDLMTVKWGVFGSGHGITTKRDVCVVDYITSALIPNMHHHERVHLWCFSSIQGERVGCMSLQQTHDVTRTRFKKFGFFWRKLSQDETEVIICGSFPSVHARHISTIMLAGLNHLQTMIEHLRLNHQHYAPRSTWVKDSERTCCQLCMRNFHALRRKHHCRHCGEVICGHCSVMESVELPAIGHAKIRMCKACDLEAKNTPLEDDHSHSNSSDHHRARSANDLHNSQHRHASFTDHDSQDSYHSGSRAAVGGYKDPLHTHHVGHHHHSGHSHSKSHHRPHQPRAAIAGQLKSGSFDVKANAGGRRHSHDYTRHEAKAISREDDEIYDLQNVHPLGHSSEYCTEDPVNESNILQAETEKLNERWEAMQNAQKHYDHVPTAIRASTSSTSSVVRSNSNMFDLLCELACQTLNCPIAAVSLINKDGESVRSATGLDGKPILDEELSLFLEKIMISTPCIVLDAHIDRDVQRIFFHRTKSGRSNIRFFAGCPIYSKSGKQLGYVCVADTEKRDVLGASYTFTMEKLATLAVTTMERHSQNNNNQESTKLSRQQQQQQHMLYVQQMGSNQHEISAIMESMHVNGDVKAYVPTSTGIRPAECTPTYYEDQTQERMRNLLIQSYYTQQQLISGGANQNQNQNQNQKEYFTLL